MRTRTAAGNRWAYVVDVDGGWPARRCWRCGRRHWMEPADRRIAARLRRPLGAEVQERRQIWSSGYRTRREADEAMRAFLQGLVEGGDPFPSDMTLAAFAPTFLARKAESVRPHTLGRYRSIIERDVVPAIGRVELRRVKPAHLQQVLDAVAADQGPSLHRGGQGRDVGPAQDGGRRGTGRHERRPWRHVEIADGAKREAELVPARRRPGQISAAGGGDDVARSAQPRRPPRHAPIGGARSAVERRRPGRGNAHHRRGLHRVRDEQGSRLACLEPKTATAAAPSLVGAPVVELLRQTTAVLRTSGD